MADLKQGQHWEHLFTLNALTGKTEIDKTIGVVSLHQIVNSLCRKPNGDWSLVQLSRLSSDPRGICRFLWGASKSGPTQASNRLIIWSSEVLGSGMGTHFHIFFEKSLRQEALKGNHLFLESPYVEKTSLFWYP